MYRRPTRPDEFASPLGCAPFAEHRSSAAELIAPHDTTTRVAVTRRGAPAPAVSAPLSLPLRVPLARNRVTCAAEDAPPGPPEPQEPERQRRWMQSLLAQLRD